MCYTISQCKKAGSGGDFPVTADTAPKNDETHLDGIAAICKNSPMPTAVIRNGKAVYKNPAYISKLGNSEPPLCERMLSAPLEKAVVIGSKPYRMYVTPCDGFAIVSLAPENDTVSVLSAAVRKAASAVSAAADTIAEISEDFKGRNELLGTIDGTMLTLLSEFLIPEEISLLRGCTPEDFPPVSVSEVGRSLSDELGEVFARMPIAVSSNVSAGLFAKLDAKALSLLLTSFISEETGGEYLPDGISVTLSRTAPDKMELTAAVSRIAKRENPLSDRAAVKPSDYAPEKELMELMTEKFGCSFKQTVKSDCSSLTVIIPMCPPPPMDRLRSPLKKYGGMSRFSNTNLMLSRYGINSRYTH